MAERTKRIYSNEVTRLQTVAEAMREDGHDEIADRYFDRAAANIQHLDHLRGIRNATIHGSALGDHAERIADWLIDNGWIPPEVLLLAEAGDES